jgi:hypothetical protein
MTDQPTKPRRRWKRWTVLALLLVIGCSVWVVFGESETVRRARQLRIGQTEAEVRAIMGDPLWQARIPTGPEPSSFVSHMQRRLNSGISGWSWHSTNCSGSFGWSMAAAPTILPPASISIQRGASNGSAADARSSTRCLAEFPPRRTTAGHNCRPLRRFGSSGSRFRRSESCSPV